MKKIAVVISVLVFFGMSLGMEKDAMVRKMKENLINFDNSYYAQEDRLTFVGNIMIKGKNVYIASNFHEWNNGNRGTTRLVLFDNDLTPLGEYAYLDMITVVKDESTLLFPCEAEWGNEWNFTNGINRTIRVDGSLYGFGVYNKKIGALYLIDIDKDVLHLNVERRWKERNQNN